MKKAICLILALVLTAVLAGCAQLTPAKPQTLPPVEATEAPTPAPTEEPTPVPEVTEEPTPVPAEEPTPAPEAENIPEEAPFDPLTYVFAGTWTLGDDSEGAGEITLNEDGSFTASGMPLGDLEGTWSFVNDYAVLSSPDLTEEVRFTSIESMDRIYYVDADQNYRYYIREEDPHTEIVFGVMEPTDSGSENTVLFTDYVMIGWNDTELQEEYGVAYDDMPNDYAMFPKKGAEPYTIELNENLSCYSIVFYEEISVQSWVDYDAFNARLVDFGTLPVYVLYHDGMLSAVSQIYLP